MEESYVVFWRTHGPGTDHFIFCDTYEEALNEYKDYFTTLKSRGITLRIAKTIKTSDNEEYIIRNGQIITTN